MLGEGKDYAGKCLIWMHGGPGVGKSAIMQSIVERCSRHAVILGTFFFSRTDTLRNFAEVLVPTLAFQLASAYPEAMAVLEPIILHDPLIIQASLRTQAYELLVRPILYLIEAGIIENTGPLRRVFVIDGLDECSDPQKQALILEVVASILCDYHVPVLFLISSRFEVAISDAFQKASRVHEGFASISLDNDPDTTSNIEHFIAASFHDIVKLHPRRADIPKNWPDRRSIDNLKWKSSGHFIYAATVMKFIASPDEHPVRALQVAEKLELSCMGDPFGDLEGVYLQILASSKNRGQVSKIQRERTDTKLEGSSLTEIFFFWTGILTTMTAVGFGIIPYLKKTVV